MVQCGKCSTQNPAGSKFCKHCGADLSIWKPGSSVSTPSGASKVVSGVDPTVHQKALDEAKRLKAQVAQLGADLRQAQATQIKGKGATAKLLQQIQTDLSQWKAKAAQFEGDLKKVQADLRKAQADLAKTRQDLAAAADPAQLSRALNELQQAQSQLQTIGQRLAARERELRQAQIDRRDKTAEADQLQAELNRRPTVSDFQNLTDERNRLSRDFVDAEQRADQADIALRAAQQSLVSVERERDQLRSALQVANRDGQQRIEEAERNLNVANQTVAWHQRELARRDDRIQELERSLQNMLYILIGAGVGGLVLIILSFVFGLGVTLPLAMLAGELLVFIKAPGWAFNPKLTIAGWGMIAASSLFVMLGMSFDASIPWGMGLLYYFAQPFIIASRAEHN